MSLRRCLTATVVVLLLAAPASARRVCDCDCNGDGAVTVDELLGIANIALGGSIIACQALAHSPDPIITVAVIVSCVNIALSGCPLETVADAAFWQTLRSEADREDEAIALYEQALTKNPGDSRSHFLKGMMHLYRYGQSLTRFDESSEFAEQEVQLANAALDVAVELAPGNRAYPGFRGAATYQNGVTHGDLALQELGVEQLRDSIDLWPLFNRFSFLGTVAAVEPPDTPLFDESYQYLLDSLSVESLAECTPELCGNAGRAPRNLEGSAILFGDIFAKGGNIGRARSWYQLAVGAGGSSGWRFTELARERLATVEQRVAAYADGVAENDPPLVGLGAESCVICHAR